MRQFILVCLMILLVGLPKQATQQSPFLRITPGPSGPPAEPSEGVVDQSFTEAVSLGANIHEAYDLIAQTYTAGRTGRLTGINIDVHSKRAMNPEYDFVVYPLRVALCEVEKVDNRYPGAVLAEVTLETDEAPLSTLITFPKVVPQIRGARYAIVVSYPNGKGSAGARWLGIWSGGRGNIGGEFLAGDGKYWTPRRKNDYSLRFRTYVAPN